MLNKKLFSVKEMKGDTGVEIHVTDDLSFITVNLVAKKKIKQVFIKKITQVVDSYWFGR